MLIETESRQVRRARLRREARPRRFFAMHSDGNRATRQARGARPFDATAVNAPHPTKGRRAPSVRRQKAQLGMLQLFRLAAHHLEARLAAA